MWFLPRSPCATTLSTPKMIHCGTIDRSLSVAEPVSDLPEVYFSFSFFARAHKQQQKKAPANNLRQWMAKKMKNSRLIFHRQGRPCWRKPLPRWGHLRCGVHHVVHLQERDSPREGPPAEWRWWKLTMSGDLLMRWQLGGYKRWWMLWVVLEAGWGDYLNRFGTLERSISVTWICSNCYGMILVQSDSQGFNFLFDWNRNSIPSINLQNTLANKPPTLFVAFFRKSRVRHFRSFCVLVPSTNNQISTISPTQHWLHLF